MLEPWLDADPDATLDGVPVEDLLKGVKDQRLEPLGIVPDLPIYDDDFDVSDHFSAGGKHFDSRTFDMPFDPMNPDHFGASDFDFGDIRPEDFDDDSGSDTDSGSPGKHD